MNRWDGFLLALRAFEVSSVENRRRILIEFAHLRIEPVEDRFLEAVGNFVNGTCLSTAAAEGQS